MGALAVDLDFGKQGKGDSVVAFAEAENFLVAAGLLVAELIAGEGQNLQSLGAIFFIELLQPLVLRRVSAAAGGVDDEQDLAAIAGERLLVPVVEFGRKIEDAGHGILSFNNARYRAACPGATKRPWDAAV